MKTKIIVLFCLCVQSLLANDKYQQAMQTNIQLVYKAQTLEEFQQAINSFERIGAAEKNKWEPYYYASFGYIMASMREQEAAKKDGLLDKAAENLKKASAINASESEIVALDGFIYMMRVSVDPASRGQQYSGLAMQSYEKALAINPDNPRALYLLAQMEFGMAQFFKSSTEGACATAAKSVEKFETYKSDNALAPAWGKESAMRVAKQCN